MMGDAAAEPSGAPPAGAAPLSDAPKDPKLIIEIGWTDAEQVAELLARGRHVVVVEGDPALVEAARARFRVALAGGRLRLIEGAVAGVAAGHDKVAYRCRGGDRMVTVSLLSVSDVLERFGVPARLAIRDCDAAAVGVAALARFRERPDRVSVAVALGAEVVAAIDGLAGLGYRRFRLAADRQPWSRWRSGTALRRRLGLGLVARFVVGRRPTVGRLEAALNSP